MFFVTKADLAQQRADMINGLRGASLRTDGFVDSINKAHGKIGAQARALQQLEGRIDELAARVAKLEDGSTIPDEITWSNCFSPRATMPLKDVVQKILDRLGLRIQSTAAKVEIVEGSDTVTYRRPLPYGECHLSVKTSVKKPTAKKKGARRG